MLNTTANVTYNSLIINETSGALGTALYVEGNSNNYTEINIQNFNNFTGASSDLIATSNMGTFQTGYVDLGINGGNYSQSTFNLTLQNDAYLYSLATNGTLAWRKFDNCNRKHWNKNVFCYRWIDNR